ncbi:MAG: M48 family metallopeptidase [Lachnospiraceae bacterium]|nr:M48 family metallopeptidase [Lachnospiraceae bacterium]
MNYKAVIIFIFLLVEMYRLFLSILNLRSEKNPIPENVADVYDKETYEKWRAYHAEKTAFGVIGSTVSFLVSILLLVFNAYAGFARLFPEELFWQTFAVVLLASLTALADIPFTWHDTMVIEQRYGFNKSTAKTFWADQIKTFLISLVIMTGIASLLFGIHKALGDWLVPAFAGIMTLFLLLFSFLYPFFSKIFNKFTPLEEGELKDRLTGLLTKNGYTVRAINVMDASRRSTKTNAYFTGFGKMKTIVLYDTLVEAMTPDEICAVFAHELGHGLHKDTLKNQILTFVQMVLIALFAWFTLRTESIFTDFGFEGINYGFALIVIMTVEFPFISPLFGLLVNFFSRKAEYSADAHAVKEGYGEHLITALKTLAKENYSNLAPSPLVVKLEYSHPTLSQRITAIEKLKG